MKVSAAKADRAKAQASKEEYKTRCRQAEEKLRDIKADKEAVQKALNKKVLLSLLIHYRNHVIAQSIVGLAKKIHACPMTLKK